MCDEEAEAVGSSAVIY